MGRDAPIDRARALTFGEVAALYDQARPSYPDRLIEDVTTMLPGRNVVEIGAGTGKATTMLARRGLRITCVEADAAMAEVLAARTAEFPDVSVVVRPFERWVPERRFDGLVCAQAWHWMLPETRWNRAAAALRPGGLLALFWNRWEWGTRSLHGHIAAVYAAHGLHEACPAPPRTDREDWPAHEIDAHPVFGAADKRSYRWSREYSGAGFTDYLRTVSDHLLLADDLRDRLLAEIAEVIDRRGDGRVTIDGRTDLYLARHR